MHVATLHIHPVTSHDQLHPVGTRCCTDCDAPRRGGSRVGIRCRRPRSETKKACLLTRPPISGARSAVQIATLRVAADRALESAAVVLVRRPKSVSPHSSSDQRRAIRVAHRRRGVTRGSMPLAGCAQEFHRTEFMASVLAGAKAERRRHAGMSGISSRRDQSAKERCGRHFVWSTSRRSG